MGVPIAFLHLIQRRHELVGTTALPRPVTGGLHPAPQWGLLSRFESMLDLRGIDFVFREKGEKK